MPSTFFPFARPASPIASSGGGSRHGIVGTGFSLEDRQRLRIVLRAEDRDQRSPDAKWQLRIGLHQGPGHVRPLESSERGRADEQGRQLRVTNGLQDPWYVGFIAGPAKSRQCRVPGRALAPREQVAVGVGGEWGCSPCFSMALMRRISASLASECVIESAEPAIDLTVRR